MTMPQHSYRSEDTDHPEMEEKSAAKKKAAGAFRTISEVAEMLDVQQHVLRFWETKFSQVRPLKRGGGRRYYRPEDVALLQKIHELLYTEGYTIKGVQKLLREKGKAQLLQGAAIDGPKTAANAKSEAPATTTSSVEAAPAQPTAPMGRGMSSRQKAVLNAVLDDLKDLRALV